MRKETYDDTRNPADFEWWHGLVKLGGPSRRHTLIKQADILEEFTGTGELKLIKMECATI